MIPERPVGAARPSSVISRRHSVALETHGGTGDTMGGVVAGEQVTPRIAEALERCLVFRPWAEQDEGPYHRDAQPFRRDIVERCEGSRLHLGIRLMGEGTALRSAMVEIWHCDAFGRYSGFPPPDDSVVVTGATAPRQEYLPDQTFLRGRQSTDGEGRVEFESIYPGWYPGRTVHIHLMVHADGVVRTTQLYFPEQVTSEVLARSPYRGRPGRDTTNDTDEIFRTGGDPAVLDVAPAGAGYVAAVGLVVPAPSRT
jgi:protocatechuate 3,4-dioxygenase beta subunit